MTSKTPMTKNVMRQLPEPVEGRRQGSLDIEDPFVVVGSPGGR